MTPIIDIVFLLMVFFMLVCQFIVAENFDVDVPDDIASAQQDQDSDTPNTTVTVMFDGSGDVVYAVGSERIVSAENSLEDVSVSIAARIDRRMQDLASGHRIVNLRIDKDIPYRQSQYALEGISLSTATDIKLAVRK
jgi:biopolymer transport protein ExbD